MGRAEDDEGDEGDAGALRRLQADNDRLRRQNQALEAARHRAQDELVAIVSHDLRGPISAIGLACDGLGADVPAEERQACVAAIRRAVARSEALLENLTRIAHIESGRFELVRARFDVRDLVAQVGRDHERAAVAAGSPLTITLDAQPALVLGDRARLHQVLSNLIGNALVHARGAAVDVSVGGDLEQVVIAVIDRGPDIADDELTSEPRRGARFAIALPRAEPAASDR